MGLSIVLTLLALCVSTTVCGNDRNNLVAPSKSAGSGFDLVRQGKQLQEADVFDKPKPPSCASTTYSTSFISTVTTTRTSWKIKTTTETSTSINTCTTAGDATCATSNILLQASIILEPTVEPPEYTTFTEWSTITVTPTLTLDVTSTVTVYTDTTTTNVAVTSPLTPLTPTVSTEYVQTSSDITTATAPPFTTTYYANVYHFVSGFTTTLPASTKTEYLPSTYTTTRTLIETRVVTASDITATAIFTGTSYTSPINLLTQTVTSTEVIKETISSQLIFYSAPNSVNIITQTESLEVALATTTPGVVPVSHTSPSTLCSVSFTETSFITQTASEVTQTVATTLVSSLLFTVTSTSTDFTTPPLPTTTIIVPTTFNLVVATDTIGMCSSVTVKTVTNQNTATVYDGVTTITATPTKTVYITESTTSTITFTPITSVGIVGTSVPLETITLLWRPVEITQSSTITSTDIQLASTTQPVPTSTVQAVGIFIHGSAPCSACLNPQTNSCGDDEIGPGLLIPAY